MMLSKFRNAIRDESGQGMTEYIIIVALIAIAAIGVVTVFGDNVRRLFGASADALAGQVTDPSTQTVNEKAFDRHNLTNFQEAQQY